MRKLRVESTKSNKFHWSSSRRTANRIYARILVCSFAYPPFSIPKVYSLILIHSLFLVKPSRMIKNHKTSGTGLIGEKNVLQSSDSAYKILTISKIKFKVGL